MRVLKLMIIPLTAVLSVLLIPVAAGQSDEVLRYHGMLLKRPQPGLVLERFITAWMETGSSDSLGEYLKQRKETAGDLLVLALFHEYEGEEAEALKAYSLALEKEPENAGAWLQRGKLEARLLEFDAALKSLDEVTKLKPDEELVLDAGKLRGRLLLRTGRTQEALTAWQELLTANPADEDLTEEVIELQLDEALYDEAAKLSQTLIEKTKEASVKVTRRLLLGDILMRGGKQAEALTVYGEALEQAGQDTWVEREVLAQIETAFRRGGDLAGLVAHLETLEAAHPQRTGLLQQKARLLAETSSGDKALETYQALLQKTPGDRAVRESYLDLLTRLEKYAEAISQTTLLLEQNPTDGELQIRLAGLQQKKGDVPAAKAALAAYLATPGVGEYEHLRVARMLENWGLKEDTKAAYVTLVKAFPGSMPARDAQAHYLHRTGERDAAVAIWQELGITDNEDELLAVAQALMTRLEPEVARAVLLEKLALHGKSDRFLAALIQATLTSREADAKEEEDAVQLRMTRLKEAVPWTMERVRMTADASQMDEVLRQAMELLKQAAVMKETMEALKAQPNLSIQERALLATLQENAGERDAAEATLNGASEADALVAKTRFIKLMEMRLDWPRAAAEAEKLMKLPGGRSSQTLQRIVELHNRAAQPEKALEWIPDWKALSPSATQPWLQEAQLLSLSGKPEAAVTVLRSAARKFDDDETVATALAQALTFSGELVEAERIYNRLYDRAEAPEEKRRWVTAIAQAAYNRADLRRVIQRFEDQQRANREDVMPWLALAEIHRIGQNEEKRRQALQEAARLQPRDVGLLLQVARAEEEAGQWQAAMRTLEKAVALDTGTRSRQQMAVLHLTYGDENAGYRILFELAGGEGMAPKDALQMADGMAKRGDWARLTEFIEPVWKNHPEDYRVGYVRAVALEEEGKLEAAGQAFIELLKARDELPEVLKAQALVQAQVASYARIQKEAQEEMPPEFVELSVILGNGLFQAYYHQYVRRQRMQGGMSGFIRVPANLEQLKGMLALHLVGINQATSPEHQDELWHQAAAAGLPCVKQLRHLQPDVNRYQMMVTEGALESSGWDPALLAYQAANAQQQALDDEVAERAFEAFGSKYPSLVLFVLIAKLQSDPEKGGVWLDQILDHYEKRSGLSQPAAMAFSQLLNGGQRVNLGNLNYEITEVQRERLRKVMLSALSQAPVDAGRLMTFIFVANSMRGSGGWRELVDLLEAELELFATTEKRQAMNGALSWHASMRKQMPMLKPLPLPPAITLPPHVALWFQQQDIYNYGEEPSMPEEDFKAVIPLLDGVKNPMLRLALAYKADDVERTEKEMKARLEAADATLEDYLMAAALAQKKEAHEEAVRLLVKAVEKPMEAELRKEVDAAIVKSVSSIIQPSKEMQQTGVQAMRRLRSGTVNPQQRDELIAAMTTLGMKEEAEQWKRIASVASPGPKMVSYRSSPASPDKVKSLMSKGNREAAMREAMNQMQSILTSYFLSGNTGYAKSLTRQILTHLQDKTAAAQLAEKLNPGDTASTLKQREFAGMLEMLNETVAAEALYAQLVERDPKDEQSRVRLVILTASKDANKAANLLKEVSFKTLAAGLGNELVNTLSQDWEMKLDDQLAIAGAIVQRLEDGSEEASANLAMDWAASLPSTLACATRHNRSSLPYIHARIPELRNQLTGMDSAEVRRVIQIHQRACLALMKYPALAETGFQWYACSRLGEKAGADEVKKDLTEKAQKILQTAAGLQRPPLMPAITRHYYQISASRWHPGPGEYLMTLARREGREESIEQEILPLVRKARMPVEVAALQLQNQLWTCPGEDFPKLAQKYVRQVSQNSRSIEQQQNLLWLADCLMERELPVPLMDQVIVEGQKQLGQEYNSYSYLASYLKMRALRSPETGMETFLASWLKSLLGAEEGWSRRMDAWVKSNYGGGNMTDLPAYCLGQTISTMLRQPGSLSSGLMLARLSGLMSNETWVVQHVYGISNEVVNDSRDTLAFLEVINALKEAEDFMTINGTGNRQHPLTYVVSGLRGKPDILAEVREDLAKIQPRTFGVEVVEALLSDTTAGNLGAVMKKRKEDLKKIPQERVAGVTTLLKDHLSALKNQTLADEDLLKALEPLLTQDQAAQRSLADRLLKANSLNELGITDTVFENDVPRLMKELVNQDRGKAKEVFLKGAKFIEAKATASGWGGDNWTQGWTYRSELVDDFNDLSPGLPALALAMQLCHEDDTGMLILDARHNEGLWGQTLMDEWKKGGGVARPAPSVDAMLKALHKELGETPPTLLALGFYELFVKLPQGVRLPVLKAALKEDTGPTQALRTELAAAGRFFLAVNPQAAGNEGLQKSLADLGGVQPAWEHYRKAILNDALNAQVRIALAAHLCRLDSRGADAALVTKAMSMIAAEHRAFRAVSGSFHYAQVSRAFCLLPMDEAWKKEAEGQWEAWVIRNSRNQESSTRNRAYNPRDEAACAILGIVARLGHEEAVPKVLSDSLDSLNDDPSAFITLVSSGAHAAAVKWLDEQWSTFIYNPNAGMGYTKALAEEMPNFLAACGEKKDLALLGEVICTTQDDPTKTGKWAGFVDRNKRVMALVPRIKDTVFTNEAMHTRCLEHTADIRETYEPLHEQYAAIMAKARVEEIMALEGTWQTFRRMKPIAASLAWQLWEKGDATAGIELFKNLAAHPTSDSNEESKRAYTFSYLGTPVVDYLEWRWGRGDKCDLAKVIAYTDGVIACAPRHNNCNTLGTHILMKQMLHIAIGDEAAFATWQKSLAEEDAKTVRQMVLKRNTFFVCAGFFGKPQPRLPLEERQKILTHMMEDPWVQDKYPPSGQGVPNMMALIVNTHKLLTLDELAACGPAFSQVLSRKGRTAAEAADLLAQNGRAEGLALYDMAIKDADTDLGLRANYIFRKCDLLERLHREADARQILTDLAKEPKLGQVPKRTLETRLARLKPKEER